MFSAQGTLFNSSWTACFTLSWLVKSSKRLRKSWSFAERVRVLVNPAFTLGRSAIDGHCGVGDGVCPKSGEMVRTAPHKMNAPASHRVGFGLSMQLFFMVFYWVS